MVFEEVDIYRIIEEMTLEEKARLVNGASFFGMAAIDRLSVPALQLLDGGTGINFEQLFGDFYSRLEEDTGDKNGMMGSALLANVIAQFYHPENLTGEERKVYCWIKERLEERAGGEYAPGCFPPGMLLGATFNQEVVHAVGQALGADARLFGVHILLGSPNVNIHRDPLNGRLFEGYSEDPCLVAGLAPELVKGVQEYGVAANVKHFAANNQETNRVGIDETISERALKEIYLPGFAACVKEGNVQTVMSAYNRINGVPCTENDRLLTEELRGNWGFSGVVLSDWGAVYHPVEAVKAGNDLAMPGPIDGTPLVEAVRSGELPEEALNRAVERLLKLIAYCMKDCLEGKESMPVGVQRVMLETDISGKRRLVKDQLLAATTKAAYDAAVEGIVLLKNEKEMFPLDSKKYSRLLVAGSAAEQLMECGTGSAGITTSRSSNLAESLKAELGEENVLVFGNDDAVLEQTLIGQGNRENIAEENEPADYVICVVQVNGMEGNDRYHLKLDDGDDRLLMKLGDWKKQKSFKLGLILNVCGPVELSQYEAFTDAVFVCFLPGMEGGHALADLMLGKKNPSGKLPLTFPKRYADTPTCLNFPGEGCHVNYGEGIYVGYRYYDKKKIAPAYSFGFGLSYTSFSVEGVAVRGDGMADSDENDTELTFSDALRLELTVRNTGSMPGAEVIQIYVSDSYSVLPKPVKELKAFEKVYLMPGESKRIAFTLKKEHFASYDSDYHMWIAEEGYYDILVATSSRKEDIRETRRVYLENETPYSYGLNSTIKTLYEQRELKQSLQKLWQKKAWDWQIVESNYQYTPNRRLSEVMPEKCREQDVETAIFLQEVKRVKKR
ncbi:MAG: glycoside hydrolase family 3 C-terminal domain-containing protein [Bacteroidales bacterium]|nr:glycoside hydrolase family 3 C-terminal domain-containing protein [Clostridium sp.]MCM1204802.1 glycoside hydrolase family 3 C-terminal domain-containing protein [Bacteroidales bacterium]